MIGPFPVELTAAADADVDGIKAWYRRERADRPDLLDRFTRALLGALHAIESNPEAFAADSGGNRHARLKKVPYVAFFKLLPARSVVFAVMHEKQDPRTWQSRA